MRKIRYKIIFLGALFSVVLMGVALLISLIMYRQNVKHDLNEDLNNALTRVKDDYSTEANIDNLKKIRSSILDVYQENPDNQTEFASYDEEYEYYRNKYPLVYPLPPGALGMSYERLNIQNIYLSISSDLLSSKYESGANDAYIVYKDEERNRMLFFIDANYEYGNYSGKGYLPGSYYEIMNEDYAKTESDNTYSDFHCSDRVIRIYDLNDEDGNYLCTLCLEYDWNVVNRNVDRFTLTLVILLAIATLVLVLSFGILANQIFVKNITSLTSATNKFKDNLLNGEKLEVVKTNIKSKDEIKVLANSFETLEEEIITYADVIEKNAKEKMKMQSELEIASQIQMSYLPKNSFSDSNVNLNAFIESAKEVGGDFYDYFYVDASHFALIIADVSGKGIPASLFMMRAKALIKDHVLANRKLEDICYNVNNLLMQDNQNHLFITAIIGVLDIDTNIFEFINCGHESPYLITKDEVIKVECNHNFILGGINNFKYQKDTLELGKSNKLFFHTDGLNEAIDKDEVEFSYEGIIKSLDKNKKENNELILHDMYNSLKEFTSGLDAFDDITMVILENKLEELNLEYLNPSLKVIDDCIESFENEFTSLNFEIKSKAGIIFDEMINNIISYNEKDLVIKIHAFIKNNKLVIEVKDNGSEFNPLEVKSIRADEREVLTKGGLGILMVRNFASDISYKYEDNFNTLTIVLDI